MFDIRPYRHLYPFECRWHHVGGHRMHYVDERPTDASGTDPCRETVVLIHGNPTWSFLFRNLIAQLRSSYRVVAMDHIGCGLSDKPDDNAYRYRLTQRVSDLTSLIDHLQVGDDVTLGVHDWGGMIGMSWALRNVKRVRRLIVFNTAAFTMPAGKRLPLRLRLIREVPMLGSVLVRGLNAFSRGATRMTTAKPMPADVRAAYRAPYDSWANRLATLRFVQDIPLAERDPSFAELKWVDENLHRLGEVPMLICWGERDFVFDTDFLAEWRRRFPNAEVHTFRDAGHLVLEDAGQEIVPLVRGFLARHSSSLTAADRVGTVA